MMQAFWAKVRAACQWIAIGLAVLAGVEIGKVIYEPEKPEPKDPP